jgi:hypothetical protein
MCVNDTQQLKILSGDVAAAELADWRLHLDEPAHCGHLLMLTGPLKKDLRSEVKPQ